MEKVIRFVCGLVFLPVRVEVMLRVLVYWAWLMCRCVYLRARIHWKGLEQERLKRRIIRRYGFAGLVALHRNGVLSVTRGGVSRLYRCVDGSGRVVPVCSIEGGE